MQTLKRKIINGARRLLNNENLRRPVLRANYYLGQYKKTIWLTGDGRSGTTWISDVINWDKRYREMFEPFHPSYVKKVHGFKHFQYLRPDDRNPYFLETAAEVFSGKLEDSRVDAKNNRYLYDGVLIKDIFAQLFVAWAQQNFPHLTTVMLIRHPFAVALSKQKLRHWVWMDDPVQLLQQQDLYQDYLAPYEDLIHTYNEDYFERQVLIWAIIHFVPFKQLARNEIHLLFYEDLCTKPQETLNDLFTYLYGDEDSQRLPTKLLEKLATPSRVVRDDSAIKTGKPLTESWMNELSTRQIDRAMAILAAFGLNEIYGTDALPNRAAAEKLLAGNRSIPA